MLPSQITERVAPFWLFDLTVIGIPTAHPVIIRRILIQPYHAWRTNNHKNNIPMHHFQSQTPSVIIDPVANHSTHHSFSQWWIHPNTVHANSSHYLLAKISQCNYQSASNNQYYYYKLHLHTNITNHQSIWISSYNYKLQHTVIQHILYKCLVYFVTNIIGDVFSFFELYCLCMLLR